MGQLYGSDKCLQTRYHKNGARGTRFAAAIFASAVTSAADTAAYLAKSFIFIDPFIIKSTIAIFFHSPAPRAQI